MTYRIKKGKHRAWPLMLGVWFNKKVMRRKVMFDLSAKYNLGNDNQQDTNKLFGIGYFWHHHKNSARVGWRYDLDTSKVIVSAYVYDNGVLSITELAKLYTSRWYGCEIRVLPNGYEFVVGEFNTRFELARTVIAKTHSIKWAYPLCFYFGGDEVAPHEITVKMKKK